MEIKHMGPYYNLSNGCYVVTHGIGYGYAIWRSEEEEGYDPSIKDKLPRWFHRVWTFQEFLLPRKLSFIVQGVDPRFVNVMNALIKQERKAGFCRCFLEPDVEHRILQESFKGSILDERNEPWIRGFELRNPGWRSVIEIIKETGLEVGKWGVGPIRSRIPIKCCNGSYNQKTDKLYVRCAGTDLEVECRDKCGGQLGNGGGGGCCMEGSGGKCDEITSEQEEQVVRPPLHNNSTNHGCRRPINSTNGGCRDNVQDAQIESHYNYPMISIQSTASICDACNSTPLIRHASESEDPILQIENHEHKPLYLFDREVFLALMQCHSNLVRDAEGQPQDRPSESMQFLRGLYCALETEGNWRPCHAICEVGHRECTEGHEEDRVLSILGLIGVQLVDQVRTGKRLREQVVEIVKMGGGVELVIELCTMNQKGGATPGFSWAPDFHGKNKKLEYALRPLHSNIEVQGFGEEDGSLKLMAKIARAMVVIPAAAEHSSDGHLHINYHNHNHNQKLELELSIHAFAHSPHTLSFDFHRHLHSSLTGSFQIPFNPTSFSHALTSSVSFPVRLLLLGTDERNSKLVMVCIPRQSGGEDVGRPEELHKIGSFALLKGGLPDFHRLLEDVDMAPCVVGGFGDDLTQYVQIK